jgi:hypothetical protein
LLGKVFQSLTVANFSLQSFSVNQKKTEEATPEPRPATDFQTIHPRTAPRPQRLWACWLWGICFLAIRLLPNAQAQAPGTVVGDGILIQITGGTYLLASYGCSVFLTANSGSSYYLIGIYVVANNNGTHSYNTTEPSTVYLGFSTA